MNRFLLTLMSCFLTLFIYSCSSDVRIPTDSYEVQNVYGKTGFLDQVKTSDTSADCIAAKTTGIDDCMRTNGSWKLAVTGVKSCKGLSITEKLGLFDWTCSDATGTATFTSAMKSSVSLANFLDPGAFKLNSLIVKDASGTTLAATEEKAWFSDTVQKLPVSTSGSAPIYLNKAGIYTFGTSSTTIMSNTIIATIDKTAVVGLKGAKLKFNDGCFDSGIPEYPLMCITVAIASEFSYVEGSFISPPADATKFNITIMSGADASNPEALLRFSEFRNINIIKNPDGADWESENAPNGLYLGGEFDKVTGTLTATGMRALTVGGVNCLISADITATDSHETVVSISKTGDYNVFTGSITVSNTDHSPFHIKGSNNIIYSNITLSDAQFGGLTLNKAAGNIFKGNISISNINNSPLGLLNGTSDTIFEGTIDIDGAAFRCIEISDNDGEGDPGLSSNSNTFTGPINISNCGDDGLFIRKSNSNSLTGLLTIHDVSNGIYLTGNAQLNSITKVRPAGNILNYDALMTEDASMIGPTNNTITSYDAALFSSCGLVPYIEHNTTSCP